LLSADSTAGHVMLADLNSQILLQQEKMTMTRSEENHEIHQKKNFQIHGTNSHSVFLQNI